MRIPVFLKESNGIKRDKEPVSIGVPVPKGLIDLNNLAAIADNEGHTAAVQLTPLAFWPDKSPKWILVDTQVSVPAGAEKEYTLILNPNEPPPVQHPVEIDQMRWCVRTGPSSFSFNLSAGQPLITVHQKKIETVGTLDFNLNLNNENDGLCQVKIDRIFTELKGPVRSVIKLQGSYSNQGKKVAHLAVKIHFFAGKSFIKTECTLHNYKPARHHGGLWDLGDPGSLLFKEFISVFTLDSKKTHSIYAALEKKNKPTQINGDHFILYQGSSGGPNWDSLNHINRLGEIPLKFRGYRTYIDGQLVGEGERTNPLLSLKGGSIGVNCFFPHFWQNFPKSLEIKDNCLKIGLFPSCYEDFHELQGGEQKTHSFFLDFTSGNDSANYLRSPLNPNLPLEWYAEAKTIPYVGANSNSLPVVKELIQAAEQGQNSFLKRREIIDEYGWRNFGDTYADHEAVGYKGKPPLISHYNNQYDLIYSFIRQYIQTSSPTWRELYEDLANHVIDIDVYRTSSDRTEFNGGFFWHTDHYLDAATSTHRSVSKAHLQYVDPQYCGGGPGLEHNYTTGLSCYYFLTGNTSARDTVLLLADWVKNVLNLPDTLFGFFSELKTKMAVWKEALRGNKIRADQYPFTRGSGNSINTLLDAYSITGGGEYLNCAESVITGCIHPQDDIASRDLLNAEDCWSYTVCLQAIGKYLDAKIERQEIDEMYDYAQKSLLHYARWMLDNEYLYLDKTEELEYPNETWPTQDLRKSCVLYFAAKHSAGDQKIKFAKSAASFYESAIRQLNEFDTKLLTRPTALLMQNSYLQDYFHKEHPEEQAPSWQGYKEYSHPSQYWNKQNIIKYCFNKTTNVLKNTSINKEIHWLNCRLNRHI